MEPPEKYRKVNDNDRKEAGTETSKNKKVTIK
jgi:hypothetical protein